MGRGEKDPLLRPKIATPKTPPLPHSRMCVYTHTRGRMHHHDRMREGRGIHPSPWLWLLSAGRGTNELVKSSAFTDPSCHPLTGRGKDGLLFGGGCGDGGALVAYFCFGSGRGGSGCNFPRANGPSHPSVQNRGGEEGRFFPGVSFPSECAPYLPAGGRGKYSPLLIFILLSPPHFSSSSFARSPSGAEGEKQGEEEK